MTQDRCGTWDRWWRATSSWASLAQLVVVVGLGLTLLLGACATGHGAASSGTPTPTVALPTTAVLGGPLTAFRAQFGPPFDDDVYFRSTDAQGQHVAIAAQQVLGTDGQLRTFSVEIGPASDSPPWDPDTAPMRYQPFLPADAILTQDVSSKDGLHRRYQSVSLAAAFSADLFVDGQGQRITPGALDVVCPTLTGPEGQRVTFSCFLKVGAQPIL